MDTTYDPTEYDFERWLGPRADRHRFLAPLRAHARAATRSPTDPASLMEPFHSLLLAVVGGKSPLEGDGLPTAGCSGRSPRDAPGADPLSPLARFRAR